MARIIQTDRMPVTAAPWTRVLLHGRHSIRQVLTREVARTVIDKRFIWNKAGQTAWSVIDDDDLENRARQYNNIVLNVTGLTTEAFEANLRSWGVSRNDASDIMLDITILFNEALTFWMNRILGRVPDATWNRTLLYFVAGILPPAGAGPNFIED